MVLLVSLVMVLLLSLVMVLLLSLVVPRFCQADVLDYHPGGFAYSAYQAHPLPAVLRVRTFVDVYEFAGRLTLTRKNIMMRDHHQCQ
jgi:hypothetical protein